MNFIQHFVNNKTTSSDSKRTGKIFNPATGEQESKVILGSKSDLDNAVKIAKKAFAENRALKEVALEMCDLSEEELDKALDPTKMTKGGFVK